MGVAESYRDGAEVSTLAGCVLRADRVVDGFEFSRCTVGGTDATAAIERLWRRLDRADVQYVMVAGVALAWYNLVDLDTVADTVDRPVISVSFEDSEGLASAIRAAFDDAESRVAAYDALPPREPVTVNGETVFVRSVGCSPSTAARVTQGFTPEGGRPEPLRVARLAARAGDAYQRAVTE